MTKKNEAAKPKPKQEGDWLKEEEILGGYVQREGKRWMDG